MSQSHTFLSRDLRPIKLDPVCCTIEVLTRIANREFQYFFNLSGHVLSGYMCQFLAERGPNMPSGTLISYCYAFSRLIESFRETGHESLNAESFSAYIDWLKKVKTRPKSDLFAENTRRSFGIFVLKLMEWLVDVSVISAREVFTARLRQRNASRGFSARQLEQMRLKAVTPEDYVRLIRAVRLEFEECKELLKRPRYEQDEYDVTFPLLPFIILLGVELAVRPVEFNHLKVRDLRGDRLLLNPPNKNCSELWLPPSVQASLSLAQDWMTLYRTNPAPDDPLLVYPLRGGPRFNQLEAVS